MQTNELPALLPALVPGWRRARLHCNEGLCGHTWLAAWQEGQVAFPCPACRQLSGYPEWPQAANLLVKGRG